MHFCLNLSVSKLSLAQDEQPIRFKTSSSNMKHSHIAVEEMMLVVPANYKSLLCALPHQNDKGEGYTERRSFHRRTRGGMSSRERL